VTLDDTIKAVQKELKVTVDGKAGPKTWGAIYDYILGAISHNLPEAAETDKVDDRSEKFIATLNEHVQPYARALVHKAASNGLTIKVISSLRTYEEQDALYAKGRSKPGKIVTNARGGYSNHNFGIAFDIGVFDGDDFIPESPAYAAVGGFGLELGLEWGGNWKTFQDEPHFQLRPKWAKDKTDSAMLTELRKRKESGKEIYE
jgi:peptidoglycan L-alanyl-D-glutamate endopeptidase CwlK